MSERDRRDRSGERRGDRGGKEERRFEERGERREERRSFREGDDRRGRDERDDARRERRGDREERREPRPRSRSERRAPKEEGGGGGGKDRTPSPAAPRMRERRSGFDQKQMLPENYAMMQMALMKTPPPMQGGMPPGGGGGMGMGGAGMGGMMMPPTNTMPNPEVELFLQHNPVEPHAATRIRSLPPELQKIVLSRGSLFGGRDPTAVLLGRVRAATRGQSGAVMGGAAGGVPWSGTTAYTPPPAQSPAPQPMPSGGNQQASTPFGQTDDQAGWARVPTASGSGGYEQGGQGADEAWMKTNPTEWVNSAGGQQSRAPQQRQRPATFSREPPPQQAQSFEDPRESQQNQQFRGMMQSSLGDLSTKLLGKNMAAQAGLVEEEEARKAAGGAPPANPFRSKPRASPVATEPDPMPMDSSPLEFNLQHTPQMSPPSGQPEYQQHQQQSQVGQQPQDNQQLAVRHERSLQDEPQKPSRGFNDGPPGSQPGLRMPEPAPEEPKQRLWSPSAQDLADLGVPPGIAVRMIRQNKILADEENMPIIPYEGGAPITAKDGPEEDEPPSAAQNSGRPALNFGPADLPGMASGGDAPKATPKGDGQTEIKRAQAIATLSYYGLTDPANQEDVAKAVQAVAAATGDQSAAVALWHQMCGTTGEGEGAVAGLTEEQQLEVQQAAQQAQYSQYWLQQQFQSQLAMFENQRLMATGDNPVNNVDDARESALRGPRGDPAVAGRKKPSTNQPMLPGDWTCPGCGDHQFARNRVCRFCGASRPIGSH